MQVRNNRDSNLQLHAYMNRGELVKYKDPVSGKELSKPAKPLLKLVHIPPLCTAEVEDDVWKAICVGTMTVKESEVIREEIEDITKGKDEKFFRNTRVPTGRSTKVNVIKQMIKGERITIVEDVKCSFTIEEKRKVVEDTGMLLPKDATEEYINKMYYIVK